jgi:hypothetical protein
MQVQNQLVSTDHSSIEIAGFDMKPEQWCTSWWHQFTVLLQRGLRERRYEAFNRLRIFQVLSVAVLGGLLWWHTPTSHIEDRVRISPACISLSPYCRYMPNHLNLCVFLYFLTFILFRILYSLHCEM